MQQLSIKLASTIALSSTLLLTACGGSSDSSGDKTPQSKVDTLVGYWQSDCDTNYKGHDKDSTLSSYDYIQLIKDGKDGLKIEQIIGETFTNDNCSGTGKLSKDDEDGLKILTQDELNTITLQGDKKFLIESEEGQDTYNRIKAEEFPIVK